MTKPYRVILFVVVAFILMASCGCEDYGNHFDWSSHPTVEDIFETVRHCGGTAACTNASEQLSKLISVSANSHGDLLMHDIIQNVFEKVSSIVPVGGFAYGRLNHALAVLAFSSGDTEKASRYLAKANHSEILTSRTHAAQTWLSKPESIGLEAFSNYSVLLTRQMLSTFDRNNVSLSGLSNYTSQSASVSHFTSAPTASEDPNDLFLGVLLSEAQGVVRSNLRMSDLLLVGSGIKALDAKQRFRLGVALSKIGLFDLSLRHVSLSATPWEAPLYRLRAKLILPTVHKSIRSLVQAVDVFETQGESILMQKIPKSPVMARICNSFDEAALALQSLPLLHLVGFASPRGGNNLGHSPTALPVLLSEIFVSMCPLMPVHPTVLLFDNDDDDSDDDDDLPQLSAITKVIDSKQQQTIDEAAAKRRETSKKYSKRKRGKSQISIGIVAGSFDGLTGQIVIGLIESISATLRQQVMFTGMCFPTPRDETTDRAYAAFDSHINLPPDNRTLTVERILEAKVHLLIFADTLLDSRVFALAHERLALWQGTMWGWGGTTGIATIDYYFIPEPLWKYSKCHLPADRVVPPQGLFTEQVILLDGLPSLPSPNKVISAPDLIPLLEDRYLLPPLSQIHIFLFPGSVKHLHPEFDRVIEIILKTDPLAVFVLAVPRRGRDNMPTTHETLRHDLLHPTMPVAAVSMLKRRLRSSLGSATSRVRVLPPLEDRIFQGLIRVSSVVLDPYPVGMHMPILDAMTLGTPVVSAPMLQECTNSHAYNIAKEVGLAPALYSESSWPRSAEEYAVQALNLQKDQHFRRKLEKHRIQNARTVSHGDQLVNFATRMLFITNMSIATERG